MESFPHIITIEVRNPLNKDEAKYFGMTWVTGQQANIFVNARKNRDDKVLKDTLMHECSHAITQLFGFSRKHEEKIAQRVGKASTEEGGPCECSRENI